MVEGASNYTCNIPYHNSILALKTCNCFIINVTKNGTKQANRVQNKSINGD